MWGIIGVVLVVIGLIWFLTTLNPFASLPEWAKGPCSKCGSGKVIWRKGKDSNSTGEAAFFCKSCGHKEFRGGCASELAMEHWEAKQ